MPIQKATIYESVENALQMCGMLTRAVQWARDELVIKREPRSFVIDSNRIDQVQPHYHGSWDDHTYDCKPRTKGSI
ncbi:MAG: hypothetical protein M3146_06025, partial [Thermoproteota archaeon]|nr:hypothetical protein [Thermoproteota archaeon]